MAIRGFLALAVVAALIGTTPKEAAATPVAQLQWTECDLNGTAVFGADAIYCTVPGAVLALTNLTSALDLTALVLRFDGNPALDLSVFENDDPGGDQDTLPLGALPPDGLARFLFFADETGHAQAFFSFDVALPAGLVLWPAVASLTSASCLPDELCITEVAAVPTPEPATIGLVLAGGAFLLRARRTVTRRT